MRYCFFKIVKEILEFVEINMNRLDAVILVNTPNQLYSKIIFLTLILKSN